MNLLSNQYLMMFLSKRYTGYIGVRQLVTQRGPSDQPTVLTIILDPVLQHGAHTTGPHCAQTFKLSLILHYFYSLSSIMCILNSC